MKGRLSHVVFCAFAAASALCVSAALSGCDEVASLFQSGKNPQNVAELCDGKHTGRHAAYQSVIDEACRKLKDAESSNSRLREQSESDRQASRESESLDQSACLAKIRAFHEQSLRLTQAKRPDLLEKKELSDKDRELLGRFAQSEEQSE